MVMVEVVEEIPEENQDKDCYRAEGQLGILMVKTRMILRRAMQALLRMNRLITVMM